MASCGKKSDGGNELEPSTDHYGHGTAPVRCGQEIISADVGDGRCLSPTSGKLPDATMVGARPLVARSTGQRSLCRAVGSVAGQVVGEALLEPRHVVEEIEG